MKAWNKRSKPKHSTLVRSRASGLSKKRMRFILNELFSFNFSKKATKREMKLEYFKIIRKEIVNKNKAIFGE